MGISRQRPVLDSRDDARKTVSLRPLERESAMEAALGNDISSSKDVSRSEEQELVANAHVLQQSPAGQPALLLADLANMQFDELSRDEAAKVLGDLAAQQSQLISQGAVGLSVLEPHKLDDSAASDRSSESGGDEHSVAEDELEDEPEPELDSDALAFLEALEGADHELACELAGLASTATANAVDCLGRNALILAAAEGHLEACRLLLSREDFRGVNGRTSVGASALHLAAANDEPEISEAILACSRFVEGVNATTYAGQTPLDFCNEFSGGAAREVLVAAGAEPGRGSRRAAVESRWRRPGRSQQGVPAG